jgi:hypothetical protein
MHRNYQLGQQLRKNFIDRIAKAQGKPVPQAIQSLRLHQMPLVRQNNKIAETRKKKSVLLQ